jgi:hypothetical protein
MIRRVAYLAVGIVVLQWISCTRDTFVDLRETAVPAKVDLVSGFQNRSVKIYFNDQLCYSATLGTNVPLSGPIADFTTTLYRGPNRLVVECWLQSPTNTYSKHTASVTVGDSHEYFLGLILQNDALTINVQDTQFLYI